MTVYAVRVIHPNRQDDFIASGINEDDWQQNALEWFRTSGRLKTPIFFRLKDPVEEEGFIHLNHAEPCASTMYYGVYLAGGNESDQAYMLLAVDRIEVSTRDVWMERIDKLRHEISLGKF